MIREPDFVTDGWVLESGEDRHAAAPDSFWIPERAHREALYPGDYAKLIFRIAIAGENDPLSVERMWVVVRERIDGAYFGLLRNEPRAIAEASLRLNSEIPFRPEHIIDIGHADEESMLISREAPLKPWPRD